MGGGSNRASQQAERNERERQAEIAQTTSRINDLFSDPSRTGQYDQLADATTDFYLGDLNRQKDNTDRNLKFALARSGQIGGSVQADKGQQVAEDYNRGVIESTRRGASAGADLRAADEQARSNLLAMAQGGLDATTASSQSANLLRNNLLAGKANAAAGQLGDFFGSVGDFYKQSKADARERKNVRDFYTLYNTGLFGQGGG